MAEFKIKDEDLNSLKGKVVIITGVFLHSTALRGIRDHILPRLTKLLDYCRRFIRHWLSHSQPLAIIRGIGLSGDIQGPAATEWGETPAPLFVQTKCDRLERPGCTLQEGDGVTRPNRLRFRQCRHRPPCQLPEAWNGWERGVERTCTWCPGYQFDKRGQHNVL